jgi:glycosyltransferase involved in cell wall biosynthesis
MTKKKGIAFLCHPYHRGGVTRWMADAAISAVRAGVEVYFVTVQPIRNFHSSGGRETMVGLLEPYKATVHLISTSVNFRFEFGSDNYRASVYSKLISDNIPKGTPVIVSDDLAVWRAAASVADRYPMVGVLHGDQDYYYNKALEFCDQLSACVCVSRRVAKTLHEKVPHLPESRIHTIPCGINLPETVSVTMSTAATRLIFVGRLTDYEKRAYDLVAICAKLHRLSFEFHLDIVGNSTESAIQFGEYFDKEQIGRFVSFHGWQSALQVQHLLYDSDILLLTSNSEGMPLVMMEALASGCGFVGTRVSGVEDYEHDLRGADCIRVYAVGDIDDAAEKIIDLAAIPRAGRKQSAGSLASAEFSMEVCLDKYFQAIESVKDVDSPPFPLDLSLKERLYSAIIALARHLKVAIMRK